MGWGPYIIESWTPGENILLHRNSYYHRAGESLPNFDQLEFRFLTSGDPNDAIAALLAGECDILDQTTELAEQIELLLSLDAYGLLNAKHSIGTTFEHVDFSIQHISYDDGYDGGAGADRLDFFSDVRMRQAITYCMDRQAAADTVYFGLSEVINTYIPSGHPLYNPAIPTYTYNPAAGIALLEDVGWLDPDGDPYTPRVATGVPGIPDGTPLEFNYQTTEAYFRQQMTQIMAESALACGIQMNLQYYPASEFFADGPDGILFGRHFDFGQFGWNDFIEPMCYVYLSSQVPGYDYETWIPILDPAAGPQPFPNGWGGYNMIGYFDPEFDTACENAMQSLSGEPGYVTYHQQAQQIIAENLPFVPVLMRTILSASGPTITGYDLDPTAQEMWNIEEFDR